VSEYQYFEFQAVDRPLTTREMAVLRRYSSRATITPTRFVNSYSYGDFKGDISVWMEKYFDAFLYQANWGSNVLMLRLPGAALPLKEAKRYCRSGSALARRHRDHVILEFRSDEEGSEDWIEEDNGRMASLLPLREALASGDWRGLYLAWLARAQYGELEPGDKEPACPPGLQSLSAPLEALVEFLRIDRDLLAVAAEASPPMRSDKRALARWVRGLGEAEKDAMLVRLMEGGSPSPRAELLQRYRMAEAPSKSVEPRGQRTVAQLLDASERRAQARERSRASKRLT
jgi:hypothetical protein